jgi:hypothetical protein
MTVVAFPERVRRFQPMTAFIDTTTPLEDGDLVVWACWEGKRVRICVWGAPDGRDGNGRFVAKGSPYELAYLDGFKYCPKNLEDGL